MQICGNTSPGGTHYDCPITQVRNLRGRGPGRQGHPSSAQAAWPRRPRSPPPCSVALLEPSLCVSDSKQIRLKYSSSKTDAASVRCEPGPGKSGRALGSIQGPLQPSFWLRSEWSYPVMVGSDSHPLGQARAQASPAPAQPSLPQGSRSLSLRLRFDHGDACNPCSDGIFLPFLFLGSQNIRALILWPIRQISLLRLSRPRPRNERPR